MSAWPFYQLLAEASYEYVPSNDEWQATLLPKILVRADGDSEVVIHERPPIVFVGSGNELTEVCECVERELNYLREEVEEMTNE